MKKRKARKLFLSIFVKSLLMVAMLLTAGILSYKAVVYYWQPKEEDSVVAYQDKVPSEGKPKADSDGIIRNVIFCYNDDTKEISKIVLELLDNENLTYLTIPVRTQYTMSASLYNKMVLDYPEVPQVLKLSAISKCFDFDKVFENGVQIIEDMLGTDINYYTAIPQSTYDEMFTQKNVKLAEGDGTFPVEVFTNECKQNLKSFDTEDKLSDYLKEIYPTFQSDLSIDNKLKYINNYYEIPVNDISFELLAGQNFNNAYVINQDNAARQLAGLE